MSHATEAPAASPSPFIVRSAFAGLCVPGRHGRAEGPAGVTVAERTGLAMASVLVRRGREAELAEAVSAQFGLALPMTPMRAAGADVAFLWTGPGQWLAIAEPAAAAGFVAGLATALDGAASVADQSHGRGVLRLAGPRLRDVLAKGIAVDLHPRAFGPGHVAATFCAHLDVLLWQIDAVPTFEIAVARGFAGSFWHWLEASSAMIGLAVTPDA